MQAMLTALDEVPLNTVITGKGNDSGRQGLVDQVESGCAGLKLHEVCVDSGCDSGHQKLMLRVTTGLGHDTRCHRLMPDSMRRA